MKAKSPSSKKDTERVIPMTLLSVGGRGCTILDRLSNLESLGVVRAAIGIPGKAFNNLKIENKIPLPVGDHIGDEMAMRTLVTSKRDEISELLGKSKITFLIGNVSEPTNCFHVAEVATIARECGNLVIFVGSMPFSFEGAPALAAAEKNRKYLGEYADGIIAIDSNKLLTENISASEATRRIDNTISLLINSIIDIVATYGYINVDYADLKSTIEGAGEIYFNSSVSTRGNTDSLADSLFSGSSLNHRVDSMNRLLYVIYAKPGLLIQEIRSICEAIAERSSANARIIFGITYEETMNDSVRVVLIGA